MNRRQFIQYGLLLIGSTIVAACANSNQRQSENFLDVLIFVNLSVLLGWLLRNWHESAVKHEN